MEEREARLLAHYRDKLAASLSRLEASEAAIEAERESVRRMRMETGPLMDEMAASLAEVVAADRKFLAGERRARLENLRAVFSRGPFLPQSLLPAFLPERLRTPSRLTTYTELSLRGRGSRRLMRRRPSMP